MEFTQYKPHYTLRRAKRVGMMNHMLITDCYTRIRGVHLHTCISITTRLQEALLHSSTCVVVNFELQNSTSVNILSKLLFSRFSYTTFHSFINVIPFSRRRNSRIWLSSMRCRHLPPVIKIFSYFLSCLYWLELYIAT